MALTAAEKQAAYRARQKVKAFVDDDLYLRNMKSLMRDRTIPDRDKFLMLSQILRNHDRAKGFDSE